MNWGSFARVEELLVPKLIKAAAAGAAIALGNTQLLVPVDTGELKASGSATPPEWVGTTVTAYIQYGAPYAGYVEFGTGVRGASSPGAGPYPYDPNWPGQPAQAFMRGGLDMSWGGILDAFQNALT